MERKDTAMVDGEIEDMSNRLKKHRRLRNLSQEELAELSGLSVRTVQRLEKGESVGSAYTLRTLATALQISPDELTGRTSQHIALHDNNLNYRLLLTWSALAGIVLPLANILLPAMLLWRRRQDPQIKEWGKKDCQFPNHPDVYNAGYDAGYTIVIGGYCGRYAFPFISYFGLFRLHGRE